MLDTTKFNDFLIITPRSNHFNRKFRFPNGYGASVICEPGSYGYEEGLWEMACLEFHSQDNSDFTIVYPKDSSFEFDVRGYLREPEVIALLDEISSMPNNSALVIH